MQEAEDQDTCRICSAPAEEGQPLFHPCKCSGTIRYIHQDCLTTWLAHSKKKHCDVCKYAYSFTKVYASDMPSRLPFILVVKRLIQQLLFGFLFILRACFVATIWLGVLPWVTVWTFRMYFSFGDTTAWWISNLPRPEIPKTDVVLRKSTNSTHPTDNWMGRITAHPLWVELSADIFMGQIIASLIVLTFVAVFLLREWISQNARPGVFDDDEIPPQQQPGVAHGLPPPQGVAAQPPQADHHQLQQALAQRQVDTMRVLDAMRARDGVNGHIVGDTKAHGRSPLDRRRKKGKGKQTTDASDVSDIGQVKVLEAVAEPRDYNEDEGRQKRSFSRRILTARLTGARRKAALEATGSGLPVPVLPEAPSSALEPADEEVNGVSSSTFPLVALQPPRDSIPFSFDHVGTMPSPPKSDNSDSAEHSDYMKDEEGSSSVSFLELSEVPQPITPSTSGSESVAGPSQPHCIHDFREVVIVEDEIGDAESSEYDVRAEVDKYFTLDQVGNYDNHQESFDGDLDMDVQDGLEEDSDSTSVTGEEAGLQHGDSEEEEDDENDGEDGEGDGGLEGPIGDIFGDDDPDEDVGNWNNEDARRENVVPQNELPVGGVVQDAPQENQVAAAGVPPVVDRNDDVDVNVEDDMEGALEAIGMRGPIYGVLQNAVLIIFLLDTAIFVAIFVPFTLGKTAALLLLDPPRFLQILHLPIRAIRVVTDPIVDSIAYLILRVLFPPFKRLIGRLVGGIFPFPGEAKQHDTLVGVSYPSMLYDSITSNFSNKVLNPVIRWWSVADASKTSILAGPTLQTRLGDYILKVEPRFAVLGMHTRLGLAKFKETWKRMATGGGHAERVFAVTLGYAVTAVILALYLNLVTVSSARTVGRAVRNAVRQQLLVIKVATFIFIELVTFPLTCGIILDLCSVWLFPQGDLMSRVTFFLQAPLISTFYHWVAGTMFMYTFAVLLSSCRRVMRPGAMWFIKDPQDQNSHPIRDILDRPTFVQLRKICISGFMYASVVACTVQTAAALLFLGSKSVMPFRWKNREPISNVPIDLLFLHLVLPYTMYYFRPRKALKAVATVIWKNLASRLRLTSYFFGDRHSAEEQVTSWWRVLRPTTVPLSGLDTDGTFRRVPATDYISLPRDMRATVQVAEDGEPFDDAAKELMIRQNIEVAKAKRASTNEFTVVYIPPHFRYRVFVFIATLWIIGAMCFGVAVVVPVQLGRSFFHLFTSREMHDGYAFIVGFYLLWGAYLVAALVDGLARRQRMRRNSEVGEDEGAGSGDGTTKARAGLSLLVAKRGLVWFGKAAYMAISFGVVLPILISFVVELYLILPVRLALDPKMVPKIRVVDMWALGLLYVKIALQINRLQHPQRGMPALAERENRDQVNRIQNQNQGQGQNLNRNFNQNERVRQQQHRIAVGVQHVLTSGWTKPNPVQATKEVIAPLMVGLTSMILVPGMVYKVGSCLLPSLYKDDRALFMHVYPGIFGLFAASRSAWVMCGRVALWSQTIRDKEFLIEMRLRNHEPEVVRRGDESEGDMGRQGEPVRVEEQQEELEEP